MEEFKKLDELCKPDVKCRLYQNWNENTGEFTTMTLADLYSSISRIRLVKMH